MGADTFEIVVKGTLGPAIVAAFEEFTMTAVADGSTHLTGWVPDQARLHGVLSLLRDLGVELVSVTRIDTPSDGQPALRIKEES